MDSVKGWLVFAFLAHVDFILFVRCRHTHRYFGNLVCEIHCQSQAIFKVIGVYLLLAFFLLLYPFLKCIYPWQFKNFKKSYSPVPHALMYHHCHTHIFVQGKSYPKWKWMTNKWLAVASPNWILALPSQTPFMPSFSGLYLYHLLNGKFILWNFILGHMVAFADVLVFSYNTFKSTVKEKRICQLKALCSLKIWSAFQCCYLFLHCGFQNCFHCIVPLGNSIPSTEFVIRVSWGLYTSSHVITLFILLRHEQQKLPGGEGDYSVA